MSQIEKNKAIKKFVEFWKDKGYEKGQSQVFWYSLLLPMGYEKQHEKNRQKKCIPEAQECTECYTPE